MKNIMALLVLAPALAWGHNSEIKSWDEVKIKKGYILSNDLHFNRNCAKIWTKQISEFESKNPKVKDANLLYVDQVIQVQNCLETPAVTKSIDQKTKEPKKQESPKDKKDSKYFATLYIGGSGVEKDGQDSAKLGALGGLKVGREFVVSEKGTFSLALGAFGLDQRSTDNAGGGKYEINSGFFNLEGGYNHRLSQKSRIGLLANIITGDDVSMADTDKDENVGAFLGVQYLRAINKKVEFDTNLQQRVDDLDRVNMFLNFGLKFNF